MKWILQEETLFHLVSGSNDWVHKLKIIDTWPNAKMHIIIHLGNCQHLEDCLKYRLKLIPQITLKECRRGTWTWRTYRVTFKEWKYTWLLFQSQHRLDALCICDNDTNRFLAVTKWFAKACEQMFWFDELWWIFTRTNYIFWQIGLLVFFDRHSSRREPFSTCLKYFIKRKQ